MSASSTLTMAMTASGRLVSSSISNSIAAARGSLHLSLNKKAHSRLSQVSSNHQSARQPDPSTINLMRRPASQQHLTPQQPPHTLESPTSTSASAAASFKRPRTSSTSAKPQQNSSQQQLQQISWTNYFELRRSRILFERVASGTLGVLGLFGGSYYFLAVADFDPTEMMFGFMDPSIGYSLAGVCVGIAGAVTGMMAGGTVWTALQKSETIKAIDVRDKEFFERVKAIRPVNIGLSLQNPMPDYYGESITSVAEYRRWIRKQRDYRIKTEGFKHARTHFLGKLP